MSFAILIASSSLSKGITDNTGPNISEKKDPPSDHEKYKNEENKFEKYFKENL